MVDENRIQGAARNFGGKIEEAAGRFTGDTETQIRGKSDRLAGTVQNSYGSMLDQAGDWTDAMLENTRAKPLTALLIAASVGYVLRILTARRR